MTIAHQVKLSKSCIRCRLTGIEGVPVKAHIIPKSFYLITQTTRGKMSFMSSRQGEFPFRSRIGTWDDSIVVQQGEDYLKRLDDYGKSVLIDKVFANRQNASEVMCISNANYSQLKLFVLSIVWRMAVTSRPELKLNNLPSDCIDLIRTMIVGSEVDDGNDISVAIGMWKQTLSTQPIPVILTPRRDSNGILKCYCGPFVFWVSFIALKSPHTILPYVLSPHAPLTVRVVPFVGSEEQMILRFLYENKKKSAKSVNPW